MSLTNWYFQETQYESQWFKPKKKHFFKHKGNKWVSIPCDMVDLSVVSLNLRGLQNKSKRNRIFQYFKIKKYDVIPLQERYSTPEDENKWKKELERPTFFSSLSNHKCGVAILCTNHKNKLIATYANFYQARSHISIDIETELIIFLTTEWYQWVFIKRPKRKEVHHTGN